MELYLIDDLPKSLIFIYDILVICLFVYTLCQQTNKKKERLARKEMYNVLVIPSQVFFYDIRYGEMQICKDTCTICNKIWQTRMICASETYVTLVIEPRFRDWGVGFNITNVGYSKTRLCSHQSNILSDR